MQHTKLFKLVSLCTSVAAAVPAYSQEDDFGFLEEIIVTAKHREQNLQEVPLPITVFSANDLIDRSIVDPRDLAAYTPNFNLQSSSGRGDPSAVAIRGVAPNTGDERFQGVNFFVDGVPLTGQISGVDLTQLERVEVIKGPQSAQFGRATYSGAINYITKKPIVDTLEGNVRLRLGSTDGAEEENNFVSARLSFPIIQDKLWASLNASTQTYGSLANNVTIPTTGVGREKTESWGAVVFAQPTENWDITLRVARDEEDDSVPAIHKIHPREFESSTTIDIDGSAGSRTTVLANRLPEPDFTFMGGNVASTVAGFPVVEGGSQRTRTLVSLSSNFEFDSGYKIEYKGSYNAQDRDQSAGRTNRDPVLDPVFGSAIADGEATFANDSNISLREDFENMSHQLMLFSPGDQAITWQIGAYYFEEENDNFFTTLAFLIPPDARTGGTDKIENTSIFGALNYAVNDKLSLSFEGRYQDEDVIIESCTVCLSPLPETTTNNSTDFLPRLTVDYQLSENNFLYALYSKGVKSGRASRVVVDGTPTAFYAQPEELDNFEIGSKNVLMGGRATLNVALFAAEVTGQQLRSTTEIEAGGSTFFATAANNVGNSDVLGFEVEGSFSVTDNFKITGGIGFADQEFTGTTPIDGLAANIINPFPVENIVTRNDDGTPDTVHLDGLSQANVPTTSGNLSGIYDLTLSNDMNLTLRLDSTYRGEFYAEQSNTTKVDDSLRFNFRSTLELNNDSNTRISFYARNLTNERDITSVGVGGATNSCDFIETDTATYGTNQTCYFAGVLRPRELGFEITSDF